MRKNPFYNYTRGEFPLSTRAARGVLPYLNRILNAALPGVQKLVRSCAKMTLWWADRALYCRKICKFACQCVKRGCGVCSIPPLKDCEWQFYELPEKTAFISFLVEKFGPFLFFAFNRSVGRSFGRWLPSYSILAGAKPSIVALVEFTHTSSIQIRSFLSFFPSVSFCCF